ncbi:MAG: L,D-transpeptidase family protein [Candidatus Omnitrophica bacterium]|nr:L,D-transpeptidase family protein [Candidatus Omnitrophota bacterium]
MTKSRLILSIIAVIIVVITAISYASLKMTQKKPASSGRVNKVKLIYNRAGELLENNEQDKAIGAYAVVVSQYPSSRYAEKSFKKLAFIYSDSGDDEKAKYYYQRLLKEFPGVEDAKDIRSRVEKINLKMMESRVSTKDSIEYTVQPGDTLYAIARKFKTTVELIKKMNGLDGDLIRIGQKLKINVAEFSILVDKAKNILILKKDGEPFKTYAVATGRDSSTPAGTFTIIDRMIKPPWTKPGVGIIMPDSPEYELGARWMPISIPGYGIHGTDDDSSIGKQTTSGCVRMHDKDVIELYNMVPKGTVVEIVDGTETPQS